MKKQKCDLVNDSLTFQKLFTDLQQSLLIKGKYDTPQAKFC